MRSGGQVSQIADVRKESIFIAQACDGPLNLVPSQFAFEASSNRLLPGQGDFDIAAFVEGLPGDCPVCLEIPISDSGEGALDPVGKAHAAMKAYRDSLSRSSSRNSGLASAALSPSLSGRNDCLRRKRCPWAG